MKGEYFLPSVVEQLIGAGKAQAKVLLSQDKWYGVTYREDKPHVIHLGPDEEEALRYSVMIC